MIDAKGNFDFLALPGRGNSGSEHWMSAWCAAFPNSSRVLQAEWDKPDPKDWIARVDAAVAAAPRKLVIVAHSLAVATTVKWAAQAGEADIAKVAGALLVAPTDVEGSDPSFDLVRTFAPMPLKRLPFPALVVASRSDPRVTFDKAQDFASAWDADIADAGDLGHMGNEARLGVWPTGLLLLGRLLAKANV
jgi:uncharacterized protein